MLSVPTPFGAIKFRGLFGYLLLGSIPFILLSSLPYAIVSDIALLLWIHGILLWWGNKELIHAGIVRRNLIGRFDLSLIPLAVGITAVMIVFSYGVILLYYYGLVTLWGNTFMELINTPSVSSILGIVAGIVVVPVIEEFFFRGVMLHAMVSRMGFGKGIWITSLLFGFAHFEFISATLFGVVLALVYIRYKSLWLPILIHVLNNAIAFLPSLFVSQSPVIPPEEISVSETLTAGLLLVGVSIPFVVYVIRHWWPTQSTILPYIVNSKQNVIFDNLKASHIGAD